MKLKYMIIVEIMLMIICMFLLVNCINYSKYVENIDYDNLEASIQDEVEFSEYFNLYFSSMDLSEYKIIKEDNGYSIMIKEESTLKNLKNIIENTLSISEKKIENSKLQIQLNNDKYILEYTFSTE